MDLRKNGCNTKKMDLIKIFMDLIASGIFN